MSLLLGADGVLLGTSLWAAKEALLHEGYHRAIIDTHGDGTVRTTLADITRQITWPRGFTARIRHHRADGERRRESARRAWWRPDCGAMNHSRATLAV